MSSRSEPSRSSIDSLSKGVDSPDSMASLTIHVPRRSKRSHGMPESGFVRTGRVVVSYLDSREALGQSSLHILARSPGTRSELMTSCHFPSRYAWTGYGVMLIVRNSVRVRTRYHRVSPPLQEPEASKKGARD